MMKITQVPALILLLALCSCKNPENKNKLQEGDILFQDLNCGPLCDAIESVTEGANGRDFSHCGLVVKSNDSLKVIEAIGDTVQISSMEKFFGRSGDLDSNRHILAGRLKDNYKNLLPTAIDFSFEQVGKPYDDEFLPDNGKWYCSELIDEAFRFANPGHPIFSREPMTYVNPKTGTFDTAWVSYFKNLGKPIPQGIPGINPGLMSRSPNLEIFYPDMHH